MKGRAPLALALVLEGTLLAAAAVAAVSLLNAGAFRAFQLSAVERELTREARLLEAPVLAALSEPGRCRRSAWMFSGAPPSA